MFIKSEACLYADEAMAPAAVSERPKNPSSIAFTIPSSIPGFGGSAAIYNSIKLLYTNKYQQNNFIIFFYCLLHL